VSSCLPVAGIGEGRCGQAGGFGCGYAEQAHDGLGELVDRGLVHSSSPPSARAVLVAGTEPPDVTELWEWTLGPGQSHSSEAHAAGTRELLFVLDGQLELRVGEDAEVFAKGDSASVLEPGLPDEISEKLLAPVGGEDLDQYQGRPGWPWHEAKRATPSR
jgi:Cupin domain